MTDTIELLETIGKDASLRRASGDDLACRLAGMNASEALKQAAVSGNSDYLKDEFGSDRFTLNHPNTVTQTVPDEEDDDLEPDLDEDEEK